MAAFAAVGLLLYNVGSSICARNVPAEAAGRYYADLSVAVNFASTGDFPVAAYAVRHTSLPRHDEGFEEFRRRLVEATSSAGLTCWNLLGTVSPRTLPNLQVIVKRADDPGRALLLGEAFKMIGIAPYLLFWLPSLFFNVVLLWAAWELATTGHGAAAFVFVMLIALSAFVADTLALDYSAAGFYVTALVLVLPIGTYATRQPQQRSAKGLIARAAFSGVLFAVSALARSGALLVIPFLVVAVAFASRGLLASRSPIELHVHGVMPRPVRVVKAPLSWLIAVAATFALVTPFAVLRAHMKRLVAATSVKYGLDSPAQAHDLWLSLWEGLGDFDRTKGHYWLDERAQLVVGNRLLMSPESERVFRDVVLREIVQDPRWFVEILAHRLFATLVQRKLWPWRPLSGFATTRAVSSNEGAIDTYYSLTATADQFGLGRHRFEVPIQLLTLCVVILLIWSLVQSARWSRSDLQTPGLLVLFFGLTALALPVAITTAGALEPQAFVFTYFLGTAFLLEAVARRAIIALATRGRRGSAASAPRTEPHD